MSGELPNVSGKDAVRVFEQAGFEVYKISGSHHIMKKPDWKYALSIPVHRTQALKKGTLRRLIRDAGLSVEDFASLYDET